MFTLINLSRCAGMLCLIWAGAPASASAEEAAPAVCDTAWRAQAAQRAEQGLALLGNYDIQDRVLLWRLLMRSEGEPGRIGFMADYASQSGPFLPLNFPDDPEVTRILSLINARQLTEALSAIEALTRIPNPANTDIATERLLVRSELLFSGVLWTTVWGGHGLRCGRPCAQMDGTARRAFPFAAALDSES